ncbi:MAG: hypothetical protein CL678_12765 [Bdellovibrionaceae bacterium]|nr:hypothetical protein [Pseudobdellovibrionaceae bacterium]|tara:strand:- start:1153 stop:1548 length:396 start_codon:yes stop_codon:yes gene_type:complete
MTLLGKERRKEKRMELLESFSFFVTVPSKGEMRLKVSDVSMSGVGFDYDVSEEPTGMTHVENNDSFRIHFYLNQSVYLPFDVKVVRVKFVDGIRKIGAQITDSGANEAIAYQSLVRMLEHLLKVGHLESGS